LLYCSAHPLGVDDDLKIIGVRSRLWWGWASEKVDKGKFAFFWSSEVQMQVGMSSPELLLLPLLAHPYPPPCLYDRRLDRRVSVFQAVAQGGVYLGSVSQW